MHKLNLIFSSLKSTLHGLGERWESLVPFLQFLIRPNPIGPKPAQERWVGWHLSGQSDWIQGCYAHVSNISSCNHATINLSDLEVCHYKSHDIGTMPSNFLGFGNMPVQISWYLYLCSFPNAIFPISQIVVRFFRTVKFTMAWV